MKHLVQRPLPDELLTSALVRTCRRTGLPIGTVARELTGGRKWSPGFFQASQLSDLARVMGTQPMELLWHHTVFPFASAFFEESVYRASLVSALATGKAATGLGATTQGVSDRARYRRFCVHCAREDAKRWGESYWHRAHNLPGVLLCAPHGSVLRQTELRTAGTLGWTCALPHELNGERVLRNKPNAFDMNLALRAVALLSRPVDSKTGRQSTWYRAELIRQGLLSTTRQINVQQLVAWVSAVGDLGGGKAIRLGFSEKDSDLLWLGLMSQPKVAIPFAPLKHLVFETALALGGRDKTIVAACDSTSTGTGTDGRRVLDHVSSGPSGRPAAELDKQYAGAVEALARAYARRGERIGVCNALKEAGCWSAFRHARKRFPRVGKVVEGLRRKVV